IRRMSAEMTDGDASKRTLPTVFGMTHPLVLKADGTKFGKSELGTIWLDPARTSPYAFYQFWVQTADADIANYLQYFSFESSAQIVALLDSLAREPEKREVQKALAREMTDLVHGRSERERAEKATQALFGAEIRELDARTLREALASAPSITIDRSRLQAAGGGLPLVDVLVESGLAASKGSARKEIQGGGVYINNERMSDVVSVLTTSHLIAGGTSIVLRKGKKSYCLIEIKG
ncbi:MAG: tyrosine--tRNA ligase, partial [Bdellovibrionota bacterium]